MGETVSIEQRMTEAERRWGIWLKRKDAHEASGPCPICHQADHDGFLIFADGGYYCRKCGATGWIDENNPHVPSREELLEIRVRELERKQAEQDQRLAALERMHRCTDHLAYHQQMGERQRDYWYSEGIYDHAIAKFLLGYCPRCPTDRDGRPSYTIPIMSRGQLENIRHRLIGADNGDKYRPHMAGLPIQLFNSDVLDAKPERVLLVEGEKKTIVLDQSGFSAVGICGKRSFMREWLPKFAGIRDVIVVLDPDAAKSADALAGMLGPRARVAQLPVKIDDAIVKYGAQLADIEQFLALARPPRGKA